MRKATVKRATKETDVEVTIDLDGGGVAQIATARLASPWPTMNRSSSETISRGEKSVMR